MNIVAVTSVYHEQPIIQQVVTHLYGQGVDTVLVSVGEGDQETFDLALNAGATTTWQTGPFDQAVEITQLAQHARLHFDAEWIIPFDADEFWVNPSGGTLRDVIDNLDEHVTSISGEVYRHVSWDDRCVEPHWLPKITFRAHEANCVNWGNHDGNGGPGQRQFSTLQIRELQYRDFEHFCHKIQKADDLYRSYDFPQEYGAHLRRLVAMDDHARQVEWQALTSEPTIHDPIDYRGDPELR